MKETIKLYAVNYCEMDTLKDRESIRTHSLEKAIQFAKYLKEEKHILYSQVVTYEYNEHCEFYEFITLHNYYKY